VKKQYENNLDFLVKVVRKNIRFMDADETSLLHSTAYHVP